MSSDGLAAFVVRRRVTILLASALLTAAAAWAAARWLVLDPSTSNLARTDSDLQAAFDELDEGYADTDLLVVAMRAPRDDAAAHRDLKAAAAEVAAGLRARPDLFPAVDDRTTGDDLGPWALLYADLDDVDEACAGFGESLRMFRAMNDHAGLNSFTGFLETGLTVGAADREDILGVYERLSHEAFRTIHGESTLTPEWTVRHVLGGEDPDEDDDGYSFSDDGTIVTVRAESDAPEEGGITGDAIPTLEARRVLRDVLPRHPGLDGGVTGLPAVEGDEMLTATHDMTRATVLSFLGVAILFFGTFRSLARPLLALVALAAAVAATFGFATVAVGHLNLLATVFAVVLVANGIDFGIHFLARYQVYRRAGHDVAGAISRSYTNAGGGILTSSLTMAAAFFAAGFTEFRGLSELGIIAGGGLILCAAAMLVLFPALLAIFDLRRAPPAAEPVPPEEPGGAWRYPVPIWAGVAGVLTVAAAAWASRGVGFDYNLLRLQSTSVESVAWEHTLIDHDNRSIFAVSVADDRDDAERRRAAFLALPEVAGVVTLYPEEEEAKRERLRALAAQVGDLRLAIAADSDPTAFVGRIERVAGRGQMPDWVRDLVAASREPGAAEALAGLERRLVDGMNAQLDFFRAAGDAPPIDPARLPGSMRDRFLGADGNVALYVFARGNIWDWSRLGTYVAALRAVDPLVVGTPVHMYLAGSSLSRSFVQAAWMSLAAIVVLIYANLRRVGDTLLAVTPLFGGIVLTLGFMALTGIHFNFANFFGIPILIGISVEGGVHMVRAWRQRQSGPILRGTVVAILTSSLTTILGFGTLIAAAHRGISTLGTVLLVGTAASLAITLTVTPALIRAIERFRPA